MAQYLPEVWSLGILRDFVFFKYYFGEKYIIVHSDHAFVL